MRCFFILTVGVLLQFKVATGIWSCSEDADCTSPPGSVCREGSCVCPLGQQSVLGGTLCSDLAPYFTSPCFEDHQCYRLSNNYQCRRLPDAAEGICDCRPGHHYLRGRCWASADYGERCARDEECLGVVRDPYSMVCNSTCVCAPGYYQRQRGECRKMGLAVGDGCVLNEDCQFTGGACDQVNFRCYNVNETADILEDVSAVKMHDIAGNGQDGGVVECDAVNRCPEPYECSRFGVCLCPIGYYSAGNNCSAELSSPAAEGQCNGLLAMIVDGICTCPPNFFFDLNMRDCVRVTRRFTDSCLTDQHCHTFGAAARCGAARPPWGLRSCECDPDVAVWDPRREMCRLFAGIGEMCEVDSDCLAGELEIQCVLDPDGQGYCTCPEGLEAVGGLCLTTGLELGDACQATAECSGTLNTVCEGGRCSCMDGYQEDGDSCAPVIGGTCSVDSDCVIENTVCVQNNGSRTCQCSDSFVDYEERCWPESQGFGAPCNVTLQCTSVLGESSSCLDGRCGCSPTHHYRDGGCWRMTGLFEVCSRSSQCFLGELTDRVVCRNSLCQCDFAYPYSEELQTCTSSAAKTVASISFFVVTLIFCMS
ncbi:unnamed protein product, partial [Iphiclides podalirius]